MFPCRKTGMSVVKNAKSAQPYGWAHLLYIKRYSPERSMSHYREAKVLFHHELPRSMVGTYEPFPVPHNVLAKGDVVGSLGHGDPQSFHGSR